MKNFQIAERWGALPKFQRLVHNVFYEMDPLLYQTLQKNIVMLSITLLIHQNDVIQLPCFQAFLYQRIYPPVCIRDLRS